jgi:hypothetical protein
MKIFSTGILTQRHVAYQRPRGGSKKHVLSLSKGSSSKAAVLFARRAYFQYVSTEKWRERRWGLFSTAPKEETQFFPIIA